ncbi:hypothetical protein D3C84_871420 [compost metagenome]
MTEGRAGEADSGPVLCSTAAGTASAVPRSMHWPSCSMASAALRSAKRSFICGSVKWISRPRFAATSTMVRLNASLPLMVRVLPKRSRARSRATATPASLMPCLRRLIDLPVSTNTVLSLLLSR